MALFQAGIDVSRYQGSINWSAVAAAGKQFAIVRIGSSNNNGAYVDPYFLQNVNGAHAAGRQVEFIVDDENFFRRDLVKIGQCRHRLA